MLPTNPPVGWRSWPAAALGAVVALSFVLGVWGNRWGAPAIWYPDETEITNRAVFMVNNRTVNPHQFTYGGLQRFLVAVGVVIPVRLYDRLFDPKPQHDRKAMLVWKTRQDTRIVRGARTVTAFFFAVLVASTAVVGLLLFDRVTGLLAALLLAITPLMVVLAHFATVDLTATAWYWLACLAALLYWQRGQPAWFYGACFLGGLAFGTKADRLLVLVPLLVSHFLARERRAGVLLTGLVLMFPLAYVVANPAFLTSTFEYLDGVSREILYNAARPSERSGYWVIIEYARAGLGTPLFILSIVGCCLGLVLGLRTGRHRALVWMFATFVPYYLFMGRLFVLPWYVPFFYPPLILLGAYGLLDGLRRLPRLAAFAGATAVAAVIAWTALRTGRALMLFDNDPREAATAWIVANAAAGSTIELVGSTALPLPSARYQSFMPANVGHCSVHLPALKRLSQSSSYVKLRAMILAAEQWTARLEGTRPPAAPREAWFDRFEQECAKPWFSLPPGIDTLWLHPDFVVIVANGVARALGPYGPSPREYSLAARFDPPDWAGAARVIDLVGLPVRIYRRLDAP